MARVAKSKPFYCQFADTGSPKQWEQVEAPNGAAAARAFLLDATAEGTHTVRVFRDTTEVFTVAVEEVRRFEVTVVGAVTP